MPPDYLKLGGILEARMKFSTTTHSWNNIFARIHQMRISLKLQSKPLNKLSHMCIHGRHINSWRISETLGWLKSIREALNKSQSQR